MQHRQALEQCPAEGQPAWIVYFACVVCNKMKYVPCIALTWRGAGFQTNLVREFFGRARNETTKWNKFGGMTVPHLK